ncbi:MAG: hypothetical protein V7722_10025 [Porticoccus sp.]
MLEIAGLAVAGIAALGTLVQAFYVAKSTNTEVKKSVIKKAELRASEPLKIGAKAVSEIIDEELLSVLQREVDIQKKKLIEAIRSSEISNEERDRIVEESRKQICQFLSDVKRFNGDSLPTKRLEKLWLSNQCKT